MRGPGAVESCAPHQRREAIKRRDAGEATREIARSYNVSHSNDFEAVAMTLGRSTQQADL
jgi:hypothetical protein